MSMANNTIFLSPMGQFHHTVASRMGSVRVLWPKQHRMKFTKPKVSQILNDRLAVWLLLGPRLTKRATPGHSDGRHSGVKPKHRDGLQREQSSRFQAVVSVHAQLLLPFFLLPLPCHAQKAKRRGPRREGEGWHELRILIGPWATRHAATTSKVRYTSSAGGKGWPACGSAAGQRKRAGYRKKGHERKKDLEERKGKKKFSKCFLQTVAHRLWGGFNPVISKLPVRVKFERIFFHNFRSLYFSPDCRGLIKKIKINKKPKTQMSSNQHDCPLFTSSCEKIGKKKPGHYSHNYEQLTL